MNDMMLTLWKAGPVMTHPKYVQTHRTQWNTVREQGDTSYSPHAWQPPHDWSVVLTLLERTPQWLAFRIHINLVAVGEVTMVREPKTSRWYCGTRGVHNRTKRGIIDHLYHAHYSTRARLSGALKG